MMAIISYSLISAKQPHYLKQLRFYRLSTHEKHEYTIKYLHLALEVIDGIHKQSIYIDMYSIRLVLYRETDRCHLSQAKRIELTKLAENVDPLNFAEV